MGLAMQFLLGVPMVGFIGAAAALDTGLQFLPLWSSALVVGGIAARYGATGEWHTMAHTAAVIGTLALSVWIFLKFGIDTRGDMGREVFAFIAILNFLVGAIMINAPLVSIAVLATTPLLDVGSSYSHAAYSLIVQRPLMTVFAYGALATLAALVAKNTQGKFSLMSTVVFGTALFLAHLGFWVGSLWGERSLNDAMYSPQVFAFAWAMICVASLMWGVWRNKRAVVNLSGIFLAINFYTQWWERLIRSPQELLIACGSGIVIVLAFWFYNNKFQAAKIVHDAQ
jgi:uncharacterized membrane protein (UPF0136 family)